MEFLIKADGFEDRNIILKPSYLSSIPKIYCEGDEIKRSNKTFLLRNNNGELVELTVKPRFLDPIPEIFIGEKRIELARSLTWYEYFWMSIPILLVFVGGGIGAFLGIMASYFSARIFRSNKPIIQKYLFSAVISTGAVLIYLVAAYLLQILVQK